MELELEFPGGQQRLAMALLILAGLLLLGLLGFFFTPQQGGKAGVLTWTEWQVLQRQRAYQRELGRLQRDAEDLTTLLNGRPDPVRGQLTAERIVQDHAEGQPALERQRQLILEAAQSVGAWSVGAISREAARDALERALEALAAVSPSEEAGATDQDAYMPNGKEGARRPSYPLAFLPVVLRE